MPIQNRVFQKEVESGYITEADAKIIDAVQTSIETLLEQTKAQVSEEAFFLLQEAVGDQ